MLHIFYFLALVAAPATTVTSTTFSIEKGITRLIPLCKNNQNSNYGSCVTAKKVTMIANIIRTKSAKYGLKKSDYPVIVAMMMSESSFTHIKGKCGEVGMLQVIPAEKHIQKIVGKYIKCRPGEKYCTKLGRPDIYGKRGIFLRYKTYRFLWAHPKYAIEAGFGEMVFWKTRWNKYFKKKFWTYFPAKHYKQRFKKKYVEQEPRLRRWWNNTKNRGKGLLWVSSYNWGGNMGKYIRARSYPMKVLKHYNIALGRKTRQVYSPYKPMIIAKKVKSSINPIVKTTSLPAVQTNSLAIKGSAH